MGRIGFVLVHGTLHVTPTIECNELRILPRVAPSVRNGCKIRVRECLPANMSRMKDVVTLDAKVVNITFTPQGHTYIYELLVNDSIENNLPCTYFVTIVFSQVVFVHILFPMQQVLDIVTFFLVSTCITSIMCV